METVEQKFSVVHHYCYKNDYNDKNSDPNEGNVREDIFSWCREGVNRKTEKYNDKRGNEDY